MNKPPNTHTIEVYRGVGDDLLLVSTTSQTLMVRLPSGGIHISKVDYQELTLLYQRMGFVLIGVINDPDFNPDDYDDLCAKLREGEGSGGIPVHYRKDEHGDAAARE